MLVSIGSIILHQLLITSYYIQNVIIIYIQSHMFNYSLILALRQDKEQQKKNTRKWPKTIAQSWLYSLFLFPSSGVYFFQILSHKDALKPEGPIHQGIKQTPKHLKVAYTISLPQYTQKWINDRLKMSQKPKKSMIRRVDLFVFFFLTNLFVNLGLSYLSHQKIHSFIIFKI
jgi:hypothetical protein